MQQQRKGKENRQLPKGWEARAAPSGKRFYINHETQTTTWVCPTSAASAAAAFSSSASSHSKGAERRKDPKHGWEIQRDPIIGPYMIDHNSWRTYLPEEAPLMWSSLNGIGPAPARREDRKPKATTIRTTTTTTRKVLSNQNGAMINSKISAAKARRHDQRAYASKLQQEIDNKHAEMTSSALAQELADTRLAGYDPQGLEQILKLSASITKGCTALTKAGARQSSGRPSEIGCISRKPSFDLISVPTNITEE